MDRRSFLHNITLSGLAALFLGLEACDPQKMHLDSIGIQLFSLPKMLETDLRSAMQMLSQMGYKELELYGPFPFSADSAKERWNAITPQLGFSGSGFFGQDIRAFKALLDEYDLKATSTHTDLDTLQNHMPQLGEAADILGWECAGIPAIPPELRSTLDDYKRIAETFNQIGEAAKKHGFKFIYHNHGYGLQEQDGIIPFNIILSETDPELVFFEMDIFWTTAGRADPLRYLKSYPGRFFAMHLKDMKPIVHFKGDGGTPDQWIELFPHMTTAGDGELDLPAIVQLAKKMGVQHFYVEQDMVASPEIALRKSIDYLKNIEL